MTFEYVFKFDDGGERRFDLPLQGNTVRLLRAPPVPLPEWTRLTFHQCPSCPLRADAHPHCPAAVALADVVDAFKDGVSHHEVDITIRSPIRDYHKRAPLQDAVGSLMGLLMVTSGCPILDKFRPMAFTHLPFATVEETLYRAISMYLLAQYLLARRGRTPDWELKHLLEIYESVSAVNRAFAIRIRNINTHDANLNALAGLDCFAGMASLAIGNDYFEELEVMFDAYLKDPAPDP